MMISRIKSKEKTNKRRAIAFHKKTKRKRTKRTVSSRMKVEAKKKKKNFNNKMMLFHRATQGVVAPQ